jgi:repressor LexA
MTEPLTQLERRVYHYLIDFLAENTYQPSIREIARQFGIKSTKTVSDLLHSLETKGCIERDESRSRGVRLLGFAAAGQTKPVPYYGTAHAGQHPGPNGDTPARSFITLDRRFVPSDDVYFVKTKGDGMVDRGVFDGDFVLIAPSARAKDGDLVLTPVDDTGGVTTRTYRAAAATESTLTDRQVEVGPTSDSTILGVVCGVFRPFFDTGEELKPVAKRGR